MDNKDLNYHLKKVKKRLIIAGTMFVGVLVCIYFAYLVIGRMSNNLADSLGLNNEIKITASKYNIYSLENDSNTFVIFQNESFSLGSLSNKRYYNVLMDKGNGKEQTELKVADVAIKDEIKADEQPYAEVTEEIRNDIILSQKVVLYIPQNYKIVNE